MEVSKLKKFISMEDLNRTDIERLIGLANKLKRKGVRKGTLPPFILGLLFFQESIRTQIGFQVATYRLGGEAFVLKETKFQRSMSSAESIEDTLRVLQSYSDIICIRHPQDGILSNLLSSVKKPIINCGNGYDEHPSQTLIDLMAIKEFSHRIDGLSVAIVGDLRHMRSGHSLLLGLSKFSNITAHCISPKILAMPDKYKTVFKKSKNILYETDKLNLKNIDVVYMAGFAPNTPVKNFSKEVLKRYQINKSILPQLKKSAVILCPLPRIDEIALEIEETKFAKFFEQSELGLYMRMAIIVELLR